MNKIALQPMQVACKVTCFYYFVEAIRKVEFYLHIELNKFESR